MKETTTSHSPEPWALIDSGFLNEVTCVDANGAFIGGYGSNEGHISKDDPNWQRIIQCVNACRGAKFDKVDSNASSKNEPGLGEVGTASRRLTDAEYAALRPCIDRAREAEERKTLVKEKQEIFECHVGFYCPGTLEWVQEWVQGQAQVPAENATQALHRMRMFAVRLGTIKLDSLKNLNASSS